MLRNLLVAVLAVQLLACGTILYPERRGQPAGKYDTDIVILDAIGLLFGIIPGVIAFAVDFSTGAIYLPKGGKSKTSDAFGQLEIRRFQLETLDTSGVEAVIERELGLEISLDSPSVILLRGREGEDVEGRLRALNRTFAQRWDVSGVVE